MKPIKLCDEERKKVIEKLNDLMDSYVFEVTNKQFSFAYDFSMKKQDEEKIVVRFSPLAYLRCMAMVKNYSSEIGWYGLVKQISPKEYYIYDILVCKQIVSGARVVTEDEDSTVFYESLTDEQANDLHFQAHSHVNMGTFASSVDINNQASTVRNMQGKGFYLFQIWNKSLDINTFIYDLDNNVFYDRDDVKLVIDDDEFGTIEEFMSSIKDKVVDMAKSGYTYSELKEKDEKKTAAEPTIKALPAAKEPEKN